MRRRMQQRLPSARRSAGSTLGTRVPTEFCSSLGNQPGGLALRRTLEKDAARQEKAAHAHHTRGQRVKKRHVQKDTKDLAQLKTLGGF